MLNIALHLRILIAVSCVLVLFFIFECIRKEKLKEKYAILWIAAGGTTLVFGVWPDLLFFISNTLKLHYLSTLSFIIIVFLILIILHFTVVISNLSDRTKSLIQDISLLELEIKDLKKSKEK